MLTRLPAGSLARTISFTLAVAMSATALVPAVHAAETEARSVVVSYSDLDLSTEEGRDELGRRIDRAAEEACGVGETTLGTRVRNRDARECFDQAKRQLESRFADAVSEAQRGG